MTEGGMQRGKGRGGYNGAWCLEAEKMEKTEDRDNTPMSDSRCERQTVRASSVNVNSCEGPLQIGNNNKMYIQNMNVSVQCPHINDVNHSTSTCRECLKYHHNDHRVMAQPRSQLAPTEGPWPMLALPAPTSHISEAKVKWPANAAVTRSSSREQSPCEDTATRRRGRKKRKKRNSNDLPEDLLDPIQSCRESALTQDAQTTDVCNQYNSDETIFDCHGCGLVPGDGIWIGPDDCKRPAIFIGGDEVMRCDPSTGVITRGRFLLTEEFNKIHIQSPGRCDLLTPVKRKQKAMSCEGDKSYKDEWNFVCFVYTGLSWCEAATKKLTLV